MNVPGSMEHINATSRANPTEAARLRLFVELIDPHELVPNWPGELGRPWYLRS